MTAGVGGAVIFFTLRSHAREGEPEILAIGLGIIAYALAVAFYTLLGVVRLRRSVKTDVRKLVGDPLPR